MLSGPTVRFFKSLPIGFRKGCICVGLGTILPGGAFEECHPPLLRSCPVLCHGIFNSPVDGVLGVQPLLSL